MNEKTKSFILESKGIRWDDFNQFYPLVVEYVPDRGEGDNMASQIATATNNLVYGWYNNGDVYDNGYALEGWWNDISSYANWLWDNVEEAGDILEMIKEITTEESYEALLYVLASELLNRDVLISYADCEAEGSIYEAEGPFEFREV